MFRGVLDLSLSSYWKLSVLLGCSSVILYLFVHVSQANSEGSNKRGTATSASKHALEKMAAHPSSTSPKVQHDNISYKVLGDDTQGRILCLADVRGRLSTLNELALETGAVAIIHTGDFGFFGTCLCYCLFVSVSHTFLVHILVARPLQFGSNQ